MHGNQMIQKMHIILFAFALLVSFSTTAHTHAADRGSAMHPFLENPLTVYLDLEYWADKDYIRQQIPVVEYVRDKELADVQIIMTRHPAGQAGTNYAISFIGSGQCSEMSNQLKYWASATQSDHETRQGYTKMLKIGLAPYIAAKSNNAEFINVNYEMDTITDQKAPKSDEDPWNHWVFELYAGGYFDAEQTSNSIHIRYGVYADKVTEDWKIRARPYFNYNEDNYEIDDTTINNTSRRDGFNGFLLKTLNDHWAAGVFSRVLSSDYHNMDFQVESSPAIEYSFFPHNEATRRSITIGYRFNHSYNDYIDTTILGKTRETLWGQSLMLRANYRQAWGSINTGVTASHHFHDFNSNRVELFTRIDLRLFKGFALTAEADFDFINDLVSVPMAEMSAEEILMEQRRRSTNFQFRGHIGFTYTFGSELAAAYNPIF